MVIATSEVARNILKYADHGQVRLSLARQSGRVGLAVVAQEDRQSGWQPDHHPIGR